MRIVVISSLKAPGHSHNTERRLLKHPRTTAVSVALFRRQSYENSLPTADHNPRNSFRALAISLARRLMNVS
jgi:hypothetical protein